MIQFLYSWFHWVPYFGPMIKAAYVASLVAKIKAEANSWDPDHNAQRRAGRNLDDALADEANDLITQVIQPLNLGILADAVRQAAVHVVISIMRQRVVG